MKFRRRTAALTLNLNSKPYLPENIDVEPPAVNFPPLTLKDIVDIDNDIKAYVCDFDSPREYYWSQYLRKPQQLFVNVHSLQDAQQPWLDAAGPIEDQLDSCAERSSQRKHFDWAFLPSAVRSDAFSSEMVMDYLRSMMATSWMPSNKQEDLRLELRPTSIRGLHVPTEASQLLTQASGDALVARAESNKHALLLATWIEDKNSFCARSLPLPIDLPVPATPRGDAETGLSSSNKLSAFWEVFDAIRSNVGDKWKPSTAFVQNRLPSSVSAAVLRAPKCKKIDIGDHECSWLMSMTSSFEPVAVENLTRTLCDTRQGSIPCLPRAMPLPLDLPIRDFPKESMSNASILALQNVITDMREVVFSAVEQSNLCCKSIPVLKVPFRKALASYHIPSMPNCVTDSSTLLWGDLDDGRCDSKFGEAAVLPLFIVSPFRQVSPNSSRRQVSPNADGKLVQSLRQIFVSSSTDRFTIGGPTLALTQCARPILRTVSPSTIRYIKSSEQDKNLVLDEIKIPASSLVVEKCVGDARFFHQQAHQDVHAYNSDTDTALLGKDRFSMEEKNGVVQRAANSASRMDCAVEFVPRLLMNAEMRDDPDKKKFQDADHCDEDNNEVWQKSRKRARQDNQDTITPEVGGNECASSTYTDFPASASAQHIKELMQPNFDDSKHEGEVLVSTPPTSSTCNNGHPVKSAPGQLGDAPNRLYTREVTNDLHGSSLKTSKRPLFDEEDYPSSLDLDRPLTDIDLIEEFVCLQKGSVPIGPSKRQALPLQPQTNISRSQLIQPPTSNISQADTDSNISSVSTLLPLTGFVRSAFLEGSAHDDDNFTPSQFSMRSIRAKTIIQTLRVEHRLKMVDVAMEKPVDFALGEGLGMCVLDVTAVDSMAKVRAFTKSLISSSLRYDSLWLIIDLGSEEDDATTRKPHHEVYQKVEGPRIMVCPPKLNVTPSSQLPSTALASCLAQLSRSVWHFPCPVHVRYAWGLSQTANLIRIAADAASYGAPKTESGTRHDIEEAFNLRETTIAAQLPPLNTFSAAVTLNATASVSGNSSSGLINLLTMPHEKLKDAVPSTVSRGRLDDLFSLVHLHSPVIDTFLDIADGITIDPLQHVQDQQCSPRPCLKSEQGDLSLHDQQTYMRESKSPHAGHSIQEEFQYIEEGTSQALLHQPCSYDSYQHVNHTMDNNPLAGSFQAGLNNEQIPSSPGYLHKAFPMTPEAQQEVATTSHPLSRSIIKGREEKLGFRSDPKLRGGQTRLQWSRRD